MTIASQAMQLFQDNHFKGELVKLKGKQEKIFRKKYYHGGRVEVFKGYGENLFYYDINSLYPFVMLQKMPCGDYRIVKKYIQNKIGFYDIELLGDTNFYVSPLIAEDKFSNYYVNGCKGEIFHVSNIDIEYLKNPNQN